MFCVTPSERSFQIFHKTEILLFHIDHDFQPSFLSDAQKAVKKSKSSKSYKNHKYILKKTFMVRKNHCIVQYLQQFILTNITTFSEFDGFLCLKKEMNDLPSTADLFIAISSVKLLIHSTGTRCATC